MKVKLKEDLFYSRLTDLVNMDKETVDDNDNQFLRDVIEIFMHFGKIIHENGNLYLYMKAGTIIELKEPTYQGPEYICNYYGLMLDFSTDGELEVVI